MSFIENLAKGFVRSAVNQVGRDGGKVISNKVYGDRHSTPIRIVGSSYVQSEEAPTNQDKINSTADLKQFGYKKELFETKIFLYPFQILGGFILPIIGPIYWLVRSVENFFKRYNRFYQIDEIPTYVSDRRYKSGMRQQGFKKVKVYSEVVSIPNNTERSFYIAKGIIALAIALGTGYGQYALGKLMFGSHKPTVIQSDMPNSNKRGNSLSEKGLTLRKEPSGKSEKLDIIPFKATLEILPDIGPEETISNQTAAWIKVKYNDKVGWVWSGLVKVE